MFKEIDKSQIDTVLAELGVKSVLTQNAKMKRSSQDGIHLYNFGIPAFRAQNGFATCPNAKQCAVGCYATTGTYKFKASVNAYENRLKLTQHEYFAQVMMSQIDKVVKKHKDGIILIRVHDSGDFYSEGYQALWYTIASQYENNPKVQFYAYTKMVSQSETLIDVKPSNFRIIYSYGGKEDSQIDTSKHYHSRVFEDLNTLFTAGYIDGTHDDTIAALGTEVKIGLVYHGVKNYSNTAWKNVK